MDVMCRLLSTSVAAEMLASLLRPASFLGAASLKRRSSVTLPIVLMLILSLVFSPPASACPFCLAPPETWAEIADKADVLLLAELVRVDLLNGDTEARSHLRILSVLREPGRRPTVSQCLGGCRSSARSARRLNAETTQLSPSGEIAEFSSSIDARLCGLTGVDGTPGARVHGELRPGKIITLYEFVTGAPGDIFLLTGRSPGGANAGATFADEMIAGTDAGVTVAQADPSPEKSERSTASEFSGKPSWSVGVFFYWEVSSPLTDLSLQYLLNLPSNSVPAMIRLPYFVHWLESEDPELAMDAWSEFARSQYEDVLAVRSLLDREKLRTWIACPDTSPERLGLYGMLLGLCGNQDDKQFLEDQIGMPRPEKDFRYGIEGVIGGYLLLAGEEGLEFLEESRLKPEGVPYTEHFAVMQAVQFMWSYESDVIPQPRLAMSLRHLLHQPQVREIVITNLSRWKDWEVAPELASMYNSSVADDERTREAILQFMIAMNRASASQPVPEELLSVSQTLLSEAEQSSPTLLKAAYRTFGGR